MTDQVLNIFTSLFLLKALFLLASGIIFVFLIVVLRQSFRMSQIVDDESASSIINGFALFNVFIGFAFFVAALIVL